MAAAQPWSSSGMEGEHLSVLISARTETNAWCSGPRERYLWERFPDVNVVWN